MPVPFRRDDSNTAHDPLAGDYCEEPQPDNRIGYQSAQGKIGILFCDELVKTLDALMKLGAYAPYEKITVRWHLS